MDVSRFVDKQCKPLNICSSSAWKHTFSSLGLDKEKLVRKNARDQATALRMDGHISLEIEADPDFVASAREAFRSGTVQHALHELSDDYDPKRTYL